MVDELDKMFDYIIIDCPAGIDSGFVRAIYGASESIVVTTPHITSVRDADKVIGILITNNITQIGLVVNRMRWDMVRKGKMLSASNIEDSLGVKLLGVLSESDDISSSASVDGKIFVRTEEVENEYIKLCKSVVNFER